MSNQTRDEVIRRKLDTTRDDPATQIVQNLADIKEEDPTDFKNIYDCADSILDNLFSNPPSSEANLQIMFDFEGYRIGVHQNGVTEFERLPDQD